MGQWHSRGHRRAPRSWRGHASGSRNSSRAARNWDTSVHVGLSEGSLAGSWVRAWGGKEKNSSKWWQWGCAQGRAPDPKAVLALGVVHEVWQCPLPAAATRTPWCPPPGDSWQPRAPRSSIWAAGLGILPRWQKDTRAQCRASAGVTGGLGEAPPGSPSPVCPPAPSPTAHRIPVQAMLRQRQVAVATGTEAVQDLAPPRPPTQSPCSPPRAPDEGPG